MTMNKVVNCGALSSEVHLQVPDGRIESEHASCTLTFTDVHVSTSSNKLINKCTFQLHNRQVHIDYLETRQKS